MSARQPSLLIVTEAVDPKDSALGFFVEWIRTLAASGARVEVWCLRHDSSTELPANVRVRVLPSGRTSRLLTFVARLVSSRFDAVFVHMSPVWAVLGGWWWRLIGSRVVLWYTHGTATRMLKAALMFVHRIVTATPEAFPVKSKKVQAIGHAVSPRFAAVERPTRHDRAVRCLAVGRVSARKRVRETVEFFDRILRQRPGSSLVWVGEPRTAADRAYAADISHPAVTFVGAKTFAELPEMYRNADLLIHASATGSLDKVVLEALASGCAILSTNPATKEAVPSAFWEGPLGPEAVNEAVLRAERGVPPEARREIATRFSLDGLASRLASELELGADHSAERGDRRSFRWMFGVAVLVRVALLVLMLATRGEASIHFSDTIQYVGLAESLRSGQGFSLNGAPFIYRTPGYPLVVAASLALFKSLIPLSVVQILISALIPMLIFLIGRELGFSRRVMRAAAWLAVVEPHLVFYATPIMADTMFTALFLGFVLVFLRLLKTPTMSRSVIAGALFGLGLMVKPLFQLLPPFFVGLLGWMSFRRHGMRTALQTTGMFIAIILALTVPWMVRNQKVFGSFSLSSQGMSAISSYLVPSIMAMRDGIPIAEAEQRRRDYLMETYAIAPVGQTDPRLSSILMPDSLRIIREHPGVVVRLIVGNTMSFWTSHTYGYLLKRYDVLPDPPTDIVPPSHLLIEGRYGEFIRAFARTVAQPFWLTVMLGRIVWAVLFLLFAFSLIRHVWRGERRLSHLTILVICAYYTAVLWINGLGVDARLRLPLMPLTILYALDAGQGLRSFSVSQMLTRLRRFVGTWARRLISWHRSAPMRTWLTLVAFLSVAIYAFAYQIPPHVDARRYHNVASHLVTLGTFCETCDVPLEKDTAIHGVGPGYQFFVAGLYKLFGIRTWVVWIAQALMHATIVVWLWSLISRVVGEDAMRKKRTLIPLTLYAIHPDVVQLGAMLMTETLFVFLLLGVVKLFLPFMERKTEDGIRNMGFGQPFHIPHSIFQILRSVFFGATLGLLTMVRPTGVPILLTAAAFMLWRRRFWAVVVTVLLFVAVQAPWAIRNERTYDKFVFNSVVGGLDVWAGLHPATAGEFDFTNAPEVQAAIEGLDADEIDALSLAEAKKIVTERPGFALLRTVHKGFKLFALTKTSAFWFHYRSNIDQLATLVASLGFNLVIWTMAFAACATVIWRRRMPHPVLTVSIIAIFLMAISPILTVVTGRYRVPMLPFAAILATWWLVDVRGKERWRSALAAGAFLVIATASDLWGSFHKVREHLNQLFG